MDEIINQRRQIDEIDEEIMRLLGERVRICRSIGLLKRRRGFQIEDVQREKEVLAHVKEKAERFELNPELTERIYRLIIELCRVVQHVDE
jgi:chorismate mutase